MEAARMNRTLDIITRAGLCAIAGALAQMPQNGHAFTYVIMDITSRSPYLTRTLLPRIANRRLMIHQIHRPDADRYLHNHPWSFADFLIVSGGYTEQRWSADRSHVDTRELAPGDVNRITSDTFHRITEVRPNTWTIGLIGKRVGSWGFWVDDALVDHVEYFRRNAYVEAGARS
jgi:hypothetical protein